MKSPDFVEAPVAPEPSYRIGELAAHTGVSREMIKYYLRAGLLPTPTKPRPNLSLYTEQHCALIGLILRFQAQTKLSLTDIANVFKAADHDPGAIELELLSDRFSAGETGTILPFDDGIEETGNLELSNEFLHELVSAGLLSSTTALTEEERQSAGLLWAAHQAGVPLHFFAQAREGILALADLEVKTMLEIQRPHLHFNEVIQSITNVDKIINRWIIREKTSHARSTFTRILENAEKALATVHDAIYIPSAIFLQRHNVDHDLQILFDQALHASTTAGQLEKTCRCAVLLAKFEQAVTLADHALEKGEDPLIFTALKCLALGMSRRLDEALVCVGELTATHSSHPLVLEARLLTMLMQAARLSGVSDASQILKEAAELFREPITFSPDSKADQFEARLLDARAKTLFPDAFAWRDDIPAQLEAMLDELVSPPTSELDLPIDACRHVFHIYGAFYLGQLYKDANNEAQARKHFEEVITLDPASNLGQRAYLNIA